jgi:sialic acid synthase SpsE
MDKVFFIADIGANWYQYGCKDMLQRAKDLIALAKDCGADAVKFQHFKADKIVSDYGFKSLQVNSHQSGWDKSVYEMYDQCSINRDWTFELANECKKNDIQFMSTPYDLEAVDLISQYSDMIKIGSGDITYRQLIKKVAKTGKFVLLGTGASDINEVMPAVNILRDLNDMNFCIMQCNTNYTNDRSNEQYTNTKVIELYKELFPFAEYGLSDHTKTNYSVLSAISLGARYIEKHFTDGKSNSPDNNFALTPKEWRWMVDESNMIMQSLGHGVKRVEENENETVIVQRRCIRAKHDLQAGSIITEKDIEFLRPAPLDSIKPYAKITGLKLKKDIIKGDYFRYENLE